METTQKPATLRAEIRKFRARCKARGDLKMVANCDAATTLRDGSYYRNIFRSIVIEAMLRERARN